MAASVTGLPIVCEVAVVGGGILGLAAAARIAQRGYRVHLFRLSNRGRPRADTLRNQGWLQSGLIYVGKLGRDRRRGRLLASQMYNAGLTMLEGLELPIPNGHDCGILRVRPDTGEVENLLADARYLGIENVVCELDPALIEKRLGPVYEPGRYYAIPDAPFPEATVLERLRHVAAEVGVTFIECETPIRLDRERESPSGLIVKWDDRQMSPQAVVMAAGAGSYELLRGLDIDPRMKIQQTPLLVINGCLSITTPIFVDRPRRFSFVLHPPDRETLPDGALVIGTAVVKEDNGFMPYDDRKISKEDVEKFAELLPSCLRDHVATGRFTAGFEVVPDGVTDGGGNDLHYVEPWVEWIDQAEGLHLLLAMPGRATMGMHTADRVLTELEDRIGSPSGGSSRSEMPSGWDGGIYMHFHPHYDFDDRTSPDEGR